MELKSLVEKSQTEDTQKDGQTTMNHVLEFEQVLLKKEIIVRIFQMSVNFGIYFKQETRKKSSIFRKLSLINPFVPNAPFLYPLKTLENLNGFLMFSGGRERMRRERMG